ncbi:hypothetical protein M3M33_13500, partial [Loigolactobacillus coryniformis]|uniref:hypothetical protein n=1 Tax=Loigolactobacillus coryniformis TaxID=1610 RepID=UPI00201A5272
TKDLEPKYRCLSLGKYDKNGFLKKEYISVNSTKLDGYCPNGVSKCCNGLIREHKGCFWRFSVDGIILEKIDIPNNIKPEIKKPVSQYTLDNIFVRKFSSIG